MYTFEYYGFQKKKKSGHEFCMAKNSNKKNPRLLHKKLLLFIK